MSSKRLSLIAILLLIVLAPLLALGVLPANSQGPTPEDACALEDKSAFDELRCTNSLNETAVDFADIASAGPLTHIYAGKDTSVQVAHELDGNTLEFYPPSRIPGNAGTFLVVDGSLYGPNFLNDTPFASVSQTVVQGSGTSNDPYKVVTIVEAGNSGVRLIQTDTYTVGSEAYRTDIQISNSSDSTKDIILYRAADCYLGASDYGYGMIDSAVGSVACTKNPNNSPSGRILQFIPLTSGSRFYQANFSQVWSWIDNRTPFPNTCRCTERIDNGMGLSWEMNLPASGQAQHSHMTSFSPLGTLPLTLQKSADSPESQPGERNGYTITINNPNQTAVTVTSITDTLPPGFSYIAGSTSGATTTNPTANERDLTWSQPLEVSAGGQLSLRFNVTVSSAPGQYTNDVRATATGYAVSPALSVAPVTVSVAVEPISIDFQLNRDAYSFPNGFFPDYTQGDMVLMFGADNTCAASNSSGTICRLKFNAIRWHASISYKLLRGLGGHCDGMTTSALRFFTGLDEPSDFQSSAQSTYELGLNNARSNISWHHVLQYAPNIQQRRILLSPNEALQQIYQALQQGELQLINLAFMNDAGTGGHSVLPYAIEDAGNGTWRVMVYDNNSPNDNNRFFLFDTNANTYSTNLVGPMGSWTGSATDRRIAVTPLTVFLQRPECPWCRNTTRNSAASLNTLLSSGIDGLLITDSDGRRIGFIDGQLVNEIPNAIAAPDINGLGTAGEPTYYLPPSVEYAIEMQGSGVENLQSEEENTVSFFGPGFVASAVDVPLVSEAKDKLTVSVDGTEVSFAAGTNKEVNLVLTGGVAENEEYEVVGIDLASGERVVLGRDYAEDRVNIDLQQAGEGIYTLILKKITEQGETKFIHEDIPVNSGDTHVVLLDTWEPGSIEICVDETGDGTTESCQALENQAIPEPPQNVNASDGTLIAQVRITWDKSDGTTYYELYRSEPGSADKQLLETRDGQYAFTDDSSNGDGTLLEYAVKACSDAGCSELSNVDTGYADMPRLDEVVNPDENDSYTVSWIPASTASYHELAESHNGGAWSEIYSGNATSLSLTGKEPGDWCYRIRGYNGIQLYSPWSPPTCTVVAADPPPESPILSEIVNDDQDDTYLVSWSSVATADNYELAERFSGGSWQTVYTGTATSQERIHQSAGNWCYRARASNSTATSGWSASECTDVKTSESKAFLPIQLR